MAEGAEFRVSQEESDLREAQIGVREICEGQIMAKLVRDLSKSHPQIAEAPGQSPNTHP
jgi:hypothetical protein